MASEKTAPSLDEMRGILRAGMSRDELYGVLDVIVVERGLRMRLPIATDGIIALPVQEGGELLLFLREDVLSYVEYEGDVFLEVESTT